MLNDFAVGPFVFDFTYSAFDANPSGGSDPIRFVASITVLPSMPWTVSRASATDSPGTASRTASASDTSPPSRPIRVTSCPAFSQRSASPPPTLPLPTTAIFMPLSSSSPQLVELALVRVLVRPPAQEARSVADPSAGDVVERDLADEL